MTRMLLVRHGESEWNAAGRWQGWADPPLSPLGRVQAEHAARALEAVDAVVASDLRRAAETAALVAAALGIDAVTIERGLRERDVGEWSGLTRDEIAERWPDWRERIACPPAGEDHDAFHARVVAAVGAVGAAHRGLAVLVVSHAGVIRALERHLGVEPEPVPNLAGRWFHLDGERIEAHDRVVLVDPEDIEVTIPPPH